MTMVDKHLMDQLRTVLGRLNTPITLLDRSDPDQAEQTAVCEEMTEGVCQRSGGCWYLPVHQPHVLLCCAENEPGACDVLTLAGSLVSLMGSSDPRSETCFDIYRRTLRHELVGAELEAMTHEYQLPDHILRTVMLFHIVATGNDTAFSLLRNITPLSGRDILVDMDRHTVVLLKDMSENPTTDELVQYCLALQETLQQETAHQMTAGIGIGRASLAELHDSYSEACKAIEVGRVFQPESTVHVFSRLVLERFMTELPEDISAYYHGLLFNRQNAKIFTDEMMYTIEMFFRTDLNLSDTARQLFIHRNTLVYRLDKIQLHTGLDLRKFDDAVTFKILMELKKCISSNPRPVRRG